MTDEDLVVRHIKCDASNTAHGRVELPNGWRATGCGTREDPDSTSVVACEQLIVDRIYGQVRVIATDVAGRRTANSSERCNVAVCRPWKHEDPVAGAAAHEYLVVYQVEGHGRIWTASL